MCLRSLPLFFCIIVCALLWGSAFPGLKFVFHKWGEMAFNERLIFAGIRFIIAGVLIFLFLWKTNPVAKIKKANLKWLLLFTVTQTFFQYILFYTGLQLTNGVLASLISSTGSFWWVLLTPIFHKTPYPNYKRWILLIVAGIGIFIAIGLPEEGASNPWIGSSILLMSTLTGILAILCLRPLKETLDPVTSTGFSLLAGGIALFICGSSALPSIPIFFEPSILIVILYLAFVSATAFSLWNSLVENYSANVLAGYRFLIPLAGMILSSFFIKNESHNPRIWIGGLIVILCIYLLSKLEPETAKQAGR